MQKRRNVPHPLSHCFTVLLSYCLLITALLITVLTACATPPRPDPALAVERYLQAKVSGDAPTVRRLLCSEMESLWQREAYAFETASQPHLEGLSCQHRGESQIVDCQGTIQADYAGEQTEFPLGAYRVIWEAGEWKWCGEEK